MWAILCALTAAERNGFAQEFTEEEEHLALEPPQEGAAFRLGLWGPVFTSVSTSSDVDGARVETKNSSFGLPAQGAGLGIGAAPSRTFGVGLDMSVASDDTELLIDGQSLGAVASTAYMFSPYVDIGFTERGTVRPFVRAQLGFGGVTRSSRADASSSDSQMEDTTSIFRLAGGVGMYIFPIEQLSIDTRLDLAYVSLTARPSQGADELETSGLGAVLVVGFSAWFGRKNVAEVEPRTASLADEPAVHMAPETPRASASEPAPKKTQSDDATLRGGGRASLEGDRALRLTMAGNVIIRLENPTKRGVENVTMSILVPESVARGADCTEPRVYYKDEEADPLGIAATTLMRGSEQVTVFDGEISVELLSKVSKRRKAKSGFYLCEQSLDIVEDQRSAIRDFLRKAK